MWRVLEDPYQMPRWWPGVKRMEGVEEDRFTQVFATRKGRTVRADFHVLASEAPERDGSTPGRRSWTQDVVGTPFERVLHESLTEVRLDPVDGGTRVTIAQHQKLRGYSRMGGFLMRRATAERLEQALAGLQKVCR